MALLNEPEGVSGNGVTGNVSTSLESNRYEKPEPASRLATIGIR
jgi:hypothetical protein